MIEASIRTDSITGNVRNSGVDTVLRQRQASVNTVTPGMGISGVARTTTFALPGPPLPATTEPATSIETAFLAF